MTDRGCRTSGVVLLAALLLLAAAGPAIAGERWGPFRGRVVDRETGQGISGAVLLATWVTVTPTPAGDTSQFYEAKEAVSGPDGTLELPRLDPPFFTWRIRGPVFQLFAPGYGDPQWVITPLGGQALVDLTVIELRPLRTREERLRNYRQAEVYTYVPLKKYPFYSNALNEERRSLGLGQ